MARSPPIATRIDSARRLPAFMQVAKQARRASDKPWMRRGSRGHRGPKSKVEWQNPKEGNRKKATKG